MRAWLCVPGCPAAGHYTDRGFWHPGPMDGCPKCDEQANVHDPDRSLRSEQRRPRSGPVDGPTTVA